MCEILKKCVELNGLVECQSVILRRAVGESFCVRNIALGEDFGLHCKW